MSIDRLVRVGVLGAGRFANDEHLPNLTRIAGVEVVAICDINETAARKSAERFHIPRIYVNAHEMIDKEEMDALWSIVPAYTRTDVESSAASKGIHLFSEKPQALEMKVARRIDNAIRQAGVFSTVGFRERYRPIFQQAKRLLAQKEVIHIYFENLSCLPPRTDEKQDWNDDIRKGGARFFDWGPHAIDYSRYMTGLDVVTAQGALNHPDKYVHPLSTSFNFIMSNGATMNMIFLENTHGQPIENGRFIENRRFVVYFEGGELTVHNYAHIKINGKTIYEAKAYNPWFELDRRFCETISSGDDSNMLNDYHDGLKSLAPVLAAWESTRHNGKPIDVKAFMQK